MDEDSLSKYDSVKNELDEIYDHIAEGIRIISKSDWYENGEKSTQFQVLPGHFVYKKIFSSFLDLMVIYQRSRNNERKRCLFTT